jgi:hypothetical protein
LIQERLEQEKKQADRELSLRERKTELKAARRAAQAACSSHYATFNYLHMNDEIDALKARIASLRQDLSEQRKVLQSVDKAASGSNGMAAAAAAAAGFGAACTGTATSTTTDNEPGPEPLVDIASDHLNQIHDGYYDCIMALSQLLQSNCCCKRQRDNLRLGRIR